VPAVEQVCRFQLRSLLQAFGTNGQYLRHLSDDVVPEIAFSQPLDIFTNTASPH
jgi:hypothetical protein